MFRFALVGLLASVAFAQNEPFKPKPPVEVDAALRARVQEFFDLHVKGQFRKAEELVAEDTKDFFYKGNKPKYLSCELSKIDYTDNFTKANAVEICEMYIMMPGFADRPMKVPTPSAWKIENGKWVWWVDQDALRNTPWGRMTPGAFPEKGAPPAPPSMANIPTNADFLFKQIQLDRNSVSLKVGEKAEIVITNTAPGVMSLSIPPGGPKEIEAKLDKANMLAGGKATLTLSAAKGAKSGVVNLQVDQTMQLLPVQVTIVPGAVPETEAPPAVPASVNPSAKAGPPAKPLELDRSSVKLKVGQSARIAITNTSPDPVSLVVPAGGPKAIAAKLNSSKLAAGAKATVTLSAAKGAKSGVVNVQVEQTGQMLPIQVTILK